MLLVVGIASPTAVVGAADDATALLRRVVTVACESPSASLSQMAARIPGATGVADEPLSVRGTTVGWERRFALAAGGEIRVERFRDQGVRVLELTPTACATACPVLARTVAAS